MRVTLVTLWAAIVVVVGSSCASCGSEPTPSIPPATFTLLDAGVGPENAAPVALLRPGTRTTNSRSSQMWSVGPRRPDGTFVVELGATRAPIVFREREQGLEYLGALHDSTTDGGVFQGADFIQTWSPVREAELVVPRVLRDGMRWRTGSDGEREYVANVSMDDTVLGRRRVFRIVGDRRVFTVIEGIGPVPGDTNFDLIVAPASAPEASWPAPSVARPLIPDEAGLAAARRFEGSAVQATALESGSLVLQIPGTPDPLGDRAGVCLEVSSRAITAGVTDSMLELTTDVPARQASPGKCYFRRTSSGFVFSTDGAALLRLDEGRALVLPRDGTGYLNGAEYAMVLESSSGGPDLVPAAPPPGYRLFSWPREYGRGSPTWLATGSQQSGRGPVDAWFIDQRGAMLATQWLGSTPGFTVPRPVALLPGRPSFIATKRDRELLATTSDGLVFRFAPDTAAIELLAHVTLPALHPLIGAVRHPSNPRRLVLVANDKTKSVSRVTDSSVQVLFSGELRFFEVEVPSTPTPAPAVPALSLTAIPRGVDLVVCGVGSMEPGPEWTLDGRPALARRLSPACVLVERSRDATADELTTRSRWHVKGSLAEVGAFELGLSDEFLTNDSQRLTVSAPSPVPGGFLSRFDVFTNELMPKRAETIDNAELFVDDTGASWAFPSSQVDTFLARADFQESRRWTLSEGSARALGKVAGGGVMVDFPVTGPGEGRIVDASGKVGPVIDPYARAGEFWFPDGFKLRRMNNRLAVVAPGASTSLAELPAGEPLGSRWTSWGADRVLISGGAATFVYERTANTLRKLDPRDLVPSRGPDGTLYGVLSPVNGAQVAEIVRVDESGFTPLSVPRPAWLAAELRPALVSVSESRMAVLFGLPPRYEIVVVERPR